MQSRFVYRKSTGFIKEYDLSMQLLSLCVIVKNEEGMKLIFIETVRQKACMVISF